MKETPFLRIGVIMNNRIVRVSTVARYALAAVLGLTLTPLGGCLVSSRSNTSTSGRTLAAEDVRSITVGQTTGDQLIQSFGAPTERVDRPDGSGTWKWCRTDTRHSSGSVFLVLGSSSSRSTTSCTVVDLKDGVVTRVRSE